MFPSLCATQVERKKQQIHVFPVHTKQYKIYLKTEEKQKVCKIVLVEVCPSSFSVLRLVNGGAGCIEF